MVKRGVHLSSDPDRIDKDWWRKIPSLSGCWEKSMLGARDVVEIIALYLVQTGRI